MTRHRSFPIIHFLLTGVQLSAEIARVGRVAFRSHASLVAENLFLRKQLAFYEERKIKPHRLRDAARLALVFWSRWFDWKNALVVVKPATLIGWHRKAFQLFWHWKSRGGRPQLPRELRSLIAEMGSRESDMGPSSCRRRTGNQARHPRIAPNRTSLLARR